MYVIYKHIYSLRRILHGGLGRLLDDGLRDLGVRVTALVQRAACECSDVDCIPPTPSPFFLYKYMYTYMYSLCVCVCRLTGLVEFVEESEGLRRDGAWEHGVLQQRAAGEAPLHEPPHVSLLILLAPAQASICIHPATEKVIVRYAIQVRVGCRES